MLLVFSVSITPKIYFHDLFTKHTDTCIANVPGPVKFTAYKFNCGFVDIIGLTPFLAFETFLSVSLPIFSERYTEELFTNLLRPATDNTQRRGPPVLQEPV